jgi:uncharacterized membrane protein YkvI
MLQPPIDLEKIPPQYSVEIKSVELVEERTSRLKREEADATHQRWRASILFYVGITVGVVVGGLCMWAALDSSFAPDTQKWAAALVTSLMTGVLGFLTGKNSR